MLHSMTSREQLHIEKKVDKWRDEFLLQWHHFQLKRIFSIELITNWNCTNRTKLFRKRRKTIKAL